MNAANVPNPLLDTLLPLAARTLEAALARLLRLDPAAAERLATLNGQSVELTWTGPGWGFRMEVVDGAVKLAPRDPEREPDLAVRGALSGVLAAMVSMRERGVLPTGAVKMSGDPGLARALGEVAEKFRPDLEAELTARLGPVWGPQLARALVSGASWARESAKSLVGDAVVHLRDDTGDLVPRAEVDTFLDDVDRLRDRVDHAAERLAALQARVRSAAK
jgi:ubiquinone biosynthesis protein UbiJ